MGRLLREAGPEAHRHDYPLVRDVKGIKIGAIWECACGKAFALRDEQKDGPYWASDLTQEQSTWVRKQAAEPAFHGLGHFTDVRPCFQEWQGSCSCGWADNAANRKVAEAMCRDHVEWAVQEAEAASRRAQNR